MEIQTINLAADVPQTFLIPGKFLEIIDAPYPLSIAFYDREGNAKADGGLVNAESGLFVDLRDSDGWGSITVVSPNAQTVKLLIGSMMGGSRRQPGVVQVVDGGRSRTLAGQAFMGNLFSTGLAGQVPLVQLWNPVGSGKRLVVKSFTASQSASGGMQFGVMNTQLTTIGAKALNKLAGGAASVADRCSQSNATGLLPDFLGSIGLGPNLPWTPPLNEPIILPPGWGLTVQGQVLASLLAAFVDFFEETI
jgi:hypothetical protein